MAKKRAKSVALSADEVAKLDFSAGLPVRIASGKYYAPPGWCEREAMWWYVSAIRSVVDSLKHYELREGYRRVLNAEVHTAEWTDLYWKFILVNEWLWTSWGGEPRSPELQSFHKNMIRYRELQGKRREEPSVLWVDENAIADVERWVSPMLKTSMVFENGQLCSNGPLTMRDLLVRLADEMDQFFDVVSLGDRSVPGVTRLWNQRTGELRAAAIVWKRVLLMSGAAKFELIGFTHRPLAAFPAGVTLVDDVRVPESGIPLLTLLANIDFALLFKPDGSWVEEIPDETLADLKTWREQILKQCERLDGPAPVARREVALDPGAIERAVERAVEKVARAFGAGDNGDAASSNPPLPKDSVSEPEPKPLRPCVRKAGKAFEEMVAKRDDLVPEPGQALSIEGWKWCMDQHYTKRLTYDTFYSYVREWRRAQSGSVSISKLPGVRPPATRSIGRREDM